VSFRFRISKRGSATGAGIRNRDTSAFLTNAIQHIVQVMCGNRFQTPFASPRGVGESSVVVNVLWGFLNLAIGNALLYIFLPQLHRRGRYVPSR
jgi:hypothetical protein